MFSPQYWPAQYWADRYWRPFSHTGVWTSILDDAAGALDGIVWRIGAASPTLEANGAAFVGSLIQPSGNYWAEFYWAPHFFTNWWKDTPTSLSAGALSGALGTMTAQFDGVSTGPAVITGLMAASIEEATAALIGTRVERQYVDISVSVQLAWSAREYPGAAGSLARTLEIVQFAAVGTFTAAGANLGTIATNLTDSTGAIAGAVTAPPSRAGTIARELEPSLGALSGAISQPEGRIGFAVSVVEDFAGELVGSYFIPDETGDIVTSLDDVGAIWAGVVFEGYVVLGPLAAIIEPSEMAARGVVAVALPILSRGDFAVEFEDLRLSVAHEPQTYELVEEI